MGSCTSKTGDRAEQITKLFVAALTKKQIDTLQTAIHYGRISVIARNSRYLSPTGGAQS